MNSFDRKFKSLKLLFRIGLVAVPLFMFGKGRYADEIVNQAPNGIENSAPFSTQ